MKQTYNVGYLQTPSVKHLANVKQALADNGLASPTTPNEMLPDLIEEGLAELKPENVRSGVKIGQVEGTIVKTIEDVSFDSYEVDKEKLVNATYKYIAKNGVDAYYSAYSSTGKYGIYHMDLITQERTQIYPYSHDFQYYFEDDNGNIYTYTSRASGSIHIKGKTATKFYNTTFTNYILHNGVLYAGAPSGKSEYASGFAIINGTDVTLINPKGTTSGFAYLHKDSRGNLYVGNSNTGGLYKVEGSTMTVVTSTSAKLTKLVETPSGKLVFFNTSLNSSVIIIDTKDNDRIHDVYVSLGTGAITFIEAPDGTLYNCGVGTSTTATKLIKIKNDIASLVLDPSALGYPSYYFTNLVITTKGDIYADIGYIFHIDKDTDEVTLISTSAMTADKYAVDEDGLFYYSTGTEILIVDGKNIITTYTKTTSSSPTKFFKNRENVMCLFSGQYLYKCNINNIEEIKIGISGKFVKETEEGMFISEAEELNSSNTVYFLANEGLSAPLKQKI